MPAKKKTLWQKLWEAVVDMVDNNKSVEDSKCMVAKCPSFPEVHKMILKGTKSSYIVQYMLDKDEMIKEYYDWVAPDVAFKRLTKVFENFRANYYKWWWYVPSFVVEAYKMKKWEFNEVEDMETLLWLMMKRLDMYHELELKWWIPMKDVADNVEVTKELVEALLRMKQSLWISDKVADKVEIWVDSKVSENFANLIKKSKDPKDFLWKLFKTKL